MSEIIASEVCLVRCPKCENLLPEITDYSVYQCGGCGAVLRARSKPIESKAASDEETSGVLSENSEGLRKADFLNRRPKDSSLGFDRDDVKSNGSLKINNNSVEQMRSSKMNQELEDSETRINESRRSVWSLDRRHRNDRFQEVDEGPSNYHFTPGNVYVEPEVEDDRVGLLRKLDELKDQIIRSRPLGDQSKEKASFFNDPIRSNIVKRDPLDQNPYHRYYKDSGDFWKFHHPRCSCLICYGNCRQARLPPPPPSPPPPPPLPAAVYYRHDHNPRFSRWSGDLHRPRRGILATGGRRCRLVAGGSPFVACCNCFELLQLPDKRNPRKKMRCAACSEVILLSVVDKKLVTNSENGKDKNTLRNTKWSSIIESSSDDFEFQSLDRLPLRTRSLTSFKSRRSNRSLSSLTSEADADFASIEKPKSEPKKSFSQPSGSPLQDHFDCSTNALENSMKDAAVATEIEISPNEYCVNTSTSQESADQPAVATEIEISPNEYCVNTSTSQESADQQNDAGGRESFFVGIIKKSFKLSKSNQNVDHGKVNGSVVITVNGHSLSERVIKKAEKLSGPIQPGDYWYDSRAGFWGMMGGPCRGIIPPFIDELNYPMPKNCADGHTGVFVNGRELHERDLNLLASRGLPTDQDRSYIIEISGRVLDEGSGNELQCLGKLAPTVESKKYGFGMKPPKPTN